MILVRQNRKLSAAPNLQNDTGLWGQFMRIVGTIVQVSAWVRALAGMASAADIFERNAWELKGPTLLPWKTIDPDPDYSGQWLVAGDLNGDGRAEIVTARQDKQLVTTVLATQLDGTVLWRWGQADTGTRGSAMTYRCRSTISTPTASPRSI